MTEATADANNKQVQIHRIYLQDASLEVPNAPSVFQQKWQPQMDVEINTSFTALETADHWSVVLRITLTAKQEEEAAYLVEVQQAGVFSLTNFANEQERQQVLATFCASQLFPYAREAVGELVTRASFPQFLLQPVNFEAMYVQHQQQMQAAAEESKSEVKH